MTHGDGVIHNSKNLLENDLLKEMSNTHKKADVLKKIIELKYRKTGIRSRSYHISDGNRSRPQIVAAFG